MAARSLALAASAVLLGLASTSVEAHQAVEVPKPNWTVAKKATYWAPLSFLDKNGVKTSESVDGFMKEKGYSTLRALMDDSKLYKVNSNADNFLCGYTDPSKGSQVIPKDSTMRTTGYTHVGPCEVWIDDERVIAGDNCHEQVSNTTKVDYSNCKGECTMRWYWLGLRYLKKKWSWQVYKNCIALTGDGPTISKGVTTTYLKAPTGVFAGKATAPVGSTPATTTKAPATTTEAPATTTEAPATTTEAPATTTTKAPATTTKTPTATTTSPKKDTVGGEGDEYATTPKPAATMKPTTAPASTPTADPVKCKVKK